ncbi:MAG: hypothetical protein Q8Q42_04375 [Nanoarchaeota archaeon]|nr:hypothetical protein [Nanoarchaeota archaeon]
MGKESKNPIYVYGSSRGYYLLKHNGLFDKSAIYSDIKARLKSYKYDINDKNHTEKVSPAGKESKIVIEASRKVTEYIKFNIEITYIIFREINVLLDDKKISKGEFEFRIMANMEKNYKDSARKNQKTFKSSRIAEVQRHIYEKTILKEKLNESEDLIFDEATEIIDIIKKHLY